MNLRHPAFASLLVALLACAAPLHTAVAQTKPRIEKAADLPRFTYPLQGRLEDVVRSAERFAPLAAAVRRDTESVLAGYEIADKGTQRELITLLAVLDYLDGRYEPALARAEQARAMQDKPADKLMSALRLRLLAGAARQHAPDSAAFRDAVAGELAAQLNAMPYEVVANEVRELKMSAEIGSEGLALGRVREVLQPLVDANGSLTNESVPGLIYARLSLAAVLPLKPVWVEGLSSYLARHKIDKPDIWNARDFTLPAKGPYSPVRLAVWDSGVDTKLFAPQVLRTAAGKPLLVAFDKYARPSNQALAPIPPELRGKLPQMVQRSKGFSDLQSNIDSVEASQVKQWLSTLAPEQYKAAIEEINLAGNYEHGTHVAGITLAGNPHARLLVARIEFGHTLKPDPCPSLDLARRDAANGHATVAFFKRHGVRVVNMSWGGSVGDTESELEKCGIGKTPDERKSFAREIYDIGKRGLTAAMAGAPGILFIAAAGNSNSDASFTESMPADIVLPNLLTVGAVDRAGDEAGFTSYGPTVKLHANGYQVESFLPGGSRVALSGTSFSAPQAANLASKLLAVKPALTPVKLIELMTRTAEATPDGRRMLMHPNKALAEAKAR